MHLSPLKKSNSVCGCTETINVPHGYIAIVKCFEKAAGGMGCHKSWSVWASRLPRLDCRCHHLGGRSTTRRPHQDAQSTTLPTDQKIQVECRDLARKKKQPSNLDEMGLKRFSAISRSASEVCLFVQMATASHAHRHLVRHRPCWLHPNQENVFLVVH